jgi:hypothetical protein
MSDPRAKRRFARGRLVRSLGGPWRLLGCSRLWTSSEPWLGLIWGVRLVVFYFFLKRVIPPVVGGPIMAVLDNIFAIA